MNEFSFVRNVIWHFIIYENVCVCVMLTKSDFNRKIPERRLSEIQIEFNNDGIDERFSQKMERGNCALDEDE